MLNLKLIVVDDDPLHGQMFVDKLKSIGFNSITYLESYKLAKEFLLGNHVDLIFLDYFLDHGRTAREFYLDIVQKMGLPVIFLSVFYNDKIFSEVKSFSHIDFLSKEIEDFDLKKSIEIVMKKAAKVEKPQIKDFLLVRKGKELFKVNTRDVEYIAVDGKYLQLKANEVDYMIRSSLTDFLEKIGANFIRVHQSYVVNTQYMVGVNLADNTVKMSTAIIPLSRSYKRQLLSTHYSS